MVALLLKCIVLAASPNPGSIAGDNLIFMQVRYSYVEIQKGGVANGSIVLEFACKHKIKSKISQGYQVKPVIIGLICY